MLVVMQKSLAAKMVFTKCITVLETPVLLQTTMGQVGCFALKYRALRRAAVRAGVEPTSQDFGTLEAGSAINVIRVGWSSGGKKRLEFVVNGVKLDRTGETQFKSPPCIFSQMSMHSHGHPP